MSLDATPSEAELLRMKEERERRGRSSQIARAPAIAPGPNALVHLATRADLATKKKHRRRSEEREHSEQSLLFAWAKSDAMLERFPELESMHAIPNGGGRTAREGAALVDEGVVAGTPDLCLPVPRLVPDRGPLRVYGACYLEMKDLQGKVRETQLRRISLLRKWNFVDVALSCTAGKALLLYYLTLAKP